MVRPNATVADNCDSKRRADRCHAADSETASLANRALYEGCHDEMRLCFSVQLFVFYATV